jgi:hypothetical protein
LGSDRILFRRLGTYANYLFLDVPQPILAEEDLIANKESRTAKRAARD